MTDFDQGRQPSLFDGITFSEGQDVVDEILATHVEQEIRQVIDPKAAVREALGATAQEEINRSRIMLGHATERSESAEMRWRRIIRRTNRPLVPRWEVPPLIRDRVRTAAAGQCQVCGVHINDAVLHVAHVLSRQDARDLTDAIGTTRPYELTMKLEDVFAACSRCNQDQGTRSRTPVEYLRIIAHNRYDFHWRFRGETALEVLGYLRTLEEWRSRLNSPISNDRAGGI